MRTSLPFSRSPEENKVFVKLNQLFSSTLVVAQLDPNWHFIVKVDASDIGMGSPAPVFRP